jgi:EmrB/QacA subfamily drug resistance transporter
MAKEVDKNQNTFQERSHSEIMVIISALMLVMLLAALDQTIVATALPRIAVDLHGLNKLSWVATAYLLTSAISTPLYGKISDMLGRKKILQIAIVIFLTGSVLCGLSQNMDQLVFFRGLQGLGAGGLLALVVTVVGDIIPPRQRGRYQGYFGATFALASVIGPLLGGFFTDSHTLGWRWIFYVNIPIGIIAFIAIATRLHLPINKTKHKIDFAGAGLLALTIASLILITVMGGVTYAWGSGVIIGLAALTVVGAILFIIRERVAAEPIFNLSLFKNDIFSVSVIMSLLAGFALFSAIIFIPEYQQIVRGYSATKSGLLMLPLIGGLLVSLLTSGRLIAKYGHYRYLPIIGSVLVIIGFWLFSHISLTTSKLDLSIWMVVLGLGMGPFTQITTLAVQNSVDRKYMGTATSSVTFFRSLGSSLGASLFGALLINHLGINLRKLLPPQAKGSHITAKSLQASTAQLKNASPSLHHAVLQSYANSFHSIYLYGIPLAAMMLITALFLRETPLKSSAEDMAKGEALEV